MPVPALESKSPHWLKRYGWIVLILLLALALRFTILGYGLPMLLYEDEPIYFRRALKLGFGDFDPDYFKKPSFFLYFYFLFYGIDYLLGQFSTWAQFVGAFWQNPTHLALLGRSITVLFSAITVWLTYRVGKRYACRWVGLVAACLLAVDATHVRHSPIVISDIPALCGVMATAWFAFSVFEKGRWRDYLLCGLMIALTMSFKYNVFVSFFLIAAHFLRMHSLGRLRQALLDAKLWGAVGLAMAVFLVLNPFILLNFGQFYADIDLERRHMLLRRANEVGGTPKLLVSFDNIFFRILPRAIGWPVYLLGLAGIGYGLLKRGPKSWLLYSFPLGFLLVVCQFRLINAKYLLPVFPFWFIACADFLLAVENQLVQRLSGRMLRKAVLAASSLLLILASLPLFSATRKHIVMYSQEDTRTSAWHGLLREVPVGAGLLLELETADILNRMSDEAVLTTRLPGARGFQVTGTVDLMHGVRQARPAEYLLISLKPYRDKDDRQRLKQSDDYYRYLSRHYVVVDVFIPYRGNVAVAKGQAIDDFLVLYGKTKARRQRPGPALVLLRKKPSDKLPE
jgi:hypothetical protein